MADREVEGVDLSELEDQYLAFEAAVLSALNLTMRKAVREDAVADTLPRLSLDDLNVIPGQWAVHVPDLADDLAAIYVQSAGMQADAFVRAGGVVVDEAEFLHDITRFSSEHAATLDYLTTASNHLVGIGDDLWADARSELLNGMDLGEDIPALTNRVRKTVDVTEARARVIARSEAVAASNGGSIAFMRSTGEVATKTWKNRLDGRTRPTHIAAGGQTVPLEAKFMVGGHPLDHPGDPAGPASETTQCRCVCLWGLKPDTAESTPDADTLSASAHTEDTMTAPDEYTDLDALVAAMDPANTTAWAGVLCVQGERTGDHREFLNLTWGNLPMPLQWQKVSSHGGVPTDETVLVGRIDTIVKNGNEIYATGLIDLGSVDGREAARLMGTRTDPAFLSGVSIVGDDPNNGLVEVTFPAGCDSEEMTVADMMRCSEPEVVTYHDTRIRAATLCDVPAIMTGQLYLTNVDAPTAMEDQMVELVAATVVHEPTVADVVESLTAAVATIAIPDLPPSWWFDEPTEMPEFGAITVTDSGRFYGLLAPGGVAHRSLQKRTEAPTKKVDYTRWATRERIVVDDDGSIRRIATGPVTMNCGHAGTSGPLARVPEVALSHYDDSCSLFATACVGENKRGDVWIAGAILPDVTGPQIARALACQLSGDWRPHRERGGGWYELTGCLMVPVPGIPVTNRKARVSMRGDALVASAVPIRFEGEPSGDCGCAETPVADTANAARLIAASVGRDKATRARELYLSIKP